MPITNRKTGLTVSFKKRNIPRTGLIQSTDNGSGIQESHITTGFGSDLVSNGTFATVTTGWTGTGATLTVDTARLKLANSGAAIGYAYQSITTTVGKTYRVRIDIDLGDAGNPSVSVGTSAGDDTLARHLISQDKDFVFKATTTTSFINLINGSAVSGEYTFFDNVALQLSNGSLYMGTVTDGTKANERDVVFAQNTRIL